MSVVVLEKDAPKLSQEEVTQLAGDAGIKINEKHVDDFATLLGALNHSITSILEGDDYIPKPDLAKYPRTDVHIPDDTDKGGWATKCTAKSTSPTNDLLKGKTIALKDNVALAGVRCTNGTNAVPNWVPELDATIATRIMDAGGTIIGKAACENACLEGVSDTSCTGSVHNPYADGYSCGGSSSGSGRLVATGSVDLAVGCDQGGSIRIPASMCGLVGLKPTWGLVPYTGIISLECTIDHAGPMTKTVQDAATFLEAIAGSDGVDDRQPPFLPEVYLEHGKRLEKWLGTVDQKKPLAGMKVGLLDEGFLLPNMDSDVHSLCSKAADKLRDLGADVTNISIPSHITASVIWMCHIPVSGTEQGLLSNMTGRKQLVMTSRVEASGQNLSQDAFDALGPSAQNFYLRYLQVKKLYGPKLHAKCTNLLRKLNDEYDRALASCDVLVMPTLPSPASKLFEDPAAHGPLERLSRNVGLVGNTAPFNSTGHPALTIPVGFVPAHEDASVKLPAGLQIVGKKFRDLECLKVGAAWERAFDWKTIAC